MRLNPAAREIPCRGARPAATSATAVLRRIRDRAFAIGVVAVCAFGAGCGGDPAASAPAPTTPPQGALPSPFADDFAVSLARDEDGAYWAAIVGRPADASPRELGVQLVRSADGQSWQLSGPVLGGWSGASPVDLWTLASKVCVSGVRKSRVVIYCEDDQQATWPSTPRSLFRSAELEEVQASDSGAVVAQSARGTQAVDQRLAAVTGPILRSKRAIVAVGGTPSAPAVVLRRPTGELDLQRLTAGRWERVASHPMRAVLGPQTGGPVLFAGRWYVPVVQAKGNDWPIRVATVDRSGWHLSNPLNQGPGSAQGVIVASDAGPVAIWQQHSDIRGGTFRATVWLKPLVGRSKSIALYRERNIGPGSISAVGVENTLVVATLRSQARAARGLRAYVSVYPMESQ